MTLQIEGWEHRLLAQAYAPLEEQLRPDYFSLSDKSRLKRAYGRCQAITSEHSRTFYLASGLLPDDQRRATRALYAFCRVSDDLVDEETGDRASLMEAWRRRNSAGHTLRNDPVALAWSDARARYNVPSQYVAQLLAGVSRDLTQQRYETFADLADYCYAVASTVGLMTMHIVGYSGKEAVPYAVKLGVALQLTNILRDVAEDWRSGRLYLPQDELAAFNLMEEDVARLVESAGAGIGQDERWTAFMEFQIARARKLYAESLPGIRLLGKNGRFAIAAAAELYRAILDDIEAYNYDVFSRRAYVSDWKKVLRLPGIWWRARFGRYGKHAIEGI